MKFNIFLISIVLLAVAAVISLIYGIATGEQKTVLIGLIISIAALVLTSIAKFKMKKNVF